MNKEKKRIVEEYLVKKERRSLKKIQLSGELNQRIFILTVALIGVLPLIPESNKVDFILETYIPFLELNYKLLLTFYFFFLICLLMFNITIVIMNLKRKSDYKKIVKEIQKLKSNQI